VIVTRTLFLFAALVVSGVAAAPRVSLIADPALSGPAGYGIAQLEKALTAQGIEVSRARGGWFTITAGLCRGAVARTPESLAVRVEKDRVELCGADSRGLMYAALDAADAVAAGGRGALPRFLPAVESPYVRERGISMYTMQRRYFESKLYDEKYWERYFDLLARSRINSFVVIFGYENGGFLAPVYPYFFDTEGFPNVRMAGLTSGQQRRNAEAFRTMIRLAHERGIEVTAGIWDHIYRGGVQGGGIEGADQTVGKALPWLVTGLSEDNLIAYTKAALARFLEVFPEIDALQFRMHAESGLKRSEMESFWHDVFAMLVRHNPKIRVDLRAKELPDSIINDALAQGLNARVSTKYWMEQMGMPFHPSHVNRENQKDRRHGYADLLKYPRKYPVHWQLWSGGTARLLLWADPEYVRRFAGSVQLGGGSSFEVNEMLATKMLGEPHDAEPRPILNAGYRYYEYEFERYWHFYQLWGRLTYNPRTPPVVWTREFRKRFGEAAGTEAMEALHLASGVLPRIVAASYEYRYFPTTRGWAEMMTGGDLAQYCTMEGSDIEQFMNVKDRARSLVEGRDVAMRTPEATADWFSERSAAILDHAARAEKAAGGRAAGELLSLVTDVRILAGLARFHAARLRGGVSYSLYQMRGVAGDLDAAIAREKEAAAAWRQVIEAAGDVYRDDLAFGVHRVGFPRHWKEELPKLEAGLAKLEEQRKTARAGAALEAKRGGDREPPVVQLAPVQTAKPGRDLEVRASAVDPSGIQALRLRYRHVTQFEDYATAEMTFDAQHRVYRAFIPGSFITPEWDLMYFVEAYDKAGNGTIAPDLDREAPYRIVEVERPTTRGSSPRRAAARLR
jgi:hypothetical protein